MLILDKVGLRKTYNMIDKIDKSYTRIYET